MTPESRQSRARKLPVRPRRRRFRPALLGIVVIGMLLAACSQKMRDQPKLNWDEASGFFADGTSSRSLVADTVPQGYRRDDPPLFTGKDANGQDLTAFPFPVTRDDLRRGQQRFD